MSDDNDMNGNDILNLSPGFFDLNNPKNNDDIVEISNLIPEKINVEHADTNTNNFVVEFFTLMVFNTTIADKSCGCDGGWSRTSTY
jgi:hypothetical protein